jgi:hypothetical protein
MIIPQRKLVQTAFETWTRVNTKATKLDFKVTENLFGRSVARPQRFFVAFRIMFPAL